MDKKPDNTENTKDFASSYMYGTRIKFQLDSYIPTEYFTRITNISEGRGDREEKDREIIFSLVRYHHSAPEGGHRFEEGCS